MIVRLRDAVREASERERAWRAEAAARAAQQRAEGAARRTAAISQALLDSAPVGVGLVDTDLRYLQVNPELAGINGLPAAAHSDGGRAEACRRAGRGSRS